MKKYYKDRRSQSWDGYRYSIQRIDLLIIAISGAGIYVCLETLKASFENPLINDVLLIKISGIPFLLSIVINLISQLTGKKANFHDFLMCEYKIDGNKNSDKKADEHDLKSECYSKWTKYLNIISLVFMLLGLSILSIFFTITF